ncbi:aspartic peptidase domain-containing protein [Armillaria luteobubalina]|uniref:Aspartic peptidase domain-containing protein n=1 Tax=Armillaria luteobubalina TaxID=153913 RepID=A0AA39URB3_9AGAR|nr:aspartic peptidase domain-containing protein [Armillaria luteobubalina]
MPTTHIIVDWKEYTDQVNITSSLIVKSTFSGFDGILGSNFASGTLSLATTTPTPTVTDNLYSQRSITNNQIGIYFAPTTLDDTLFLSHTNCNPVLSGTDSSEITGSIGYAYIPHLSDGIFGLGITYPASVYWGINESITYGTSTSILSSIVGIVDTRTILVYISSNATTLDSTTGLLCITSTQYTKLSSLIFNINGISFAPFLAQIWPRSLYAEIGCSSSTIYLIDDDIGTNSGEGLHFINGYTFFEWFYTVFNTANSRIGFAKAAQTPATMN